MTQVDVGASSPVAVGARLYRWRGRRLLGVIVKASYTLQQRQEMVPIGPLHWRTKANVAHAGDEPFPLEVAEIIVGPLPQPARAVGNEVALTITRGPRILLDVRRRVGDEGARDATAGFGPVAASSPLRASFAAAMDVSAFRGVRELPLEAKLDAAFFQSAPIEQRTEDLQGGDMLTLLGMSHIAKAMQTTLPHHRGHAMVQEDDGAPRRLPLRLDRIHVAPDAMVAELSFRGMVEIASAAHVVRVLGGLETETRPFAPLPFDAVRMIPLEALADGMPAPEEAAPPTQVLAPVGRHGGTLVLSPSFESTAVLESDATAPSSLPFRKNVAATPHAAPSAPIPGAPWEDAQVSPAPPILRGEDDDRPPETVALVAPVFGQPLGIMPLVNESAVSEAATERVPPTGASAEPADVVALSLDDAPDPGEPAAMEREPAPPTAPPAARARAKADPWRKDPEPSATPAPVPPPPPPKASPTRPDISGGLYKKFKR